MTNLQINRRSAVQSLLAISASGALASCGNGDGGVLASAVDDTRYAAGARFFGDEEMQAIAAWSDTIIPTTDTPGAVAAGVPEKLQSLASVWGDDVYRAYWRKGLRELGGSLDALSGEETRSLAPAARERVLAQHDAAVFGGKTKDPFYRDFKRTVATAYYMSEPGATEELAYEPVPGEWIGDAPISRFPKTWAT